MVTKWCLIDALFLTFVYKFVQLDKFFIGGRSYEFEKVSFIQRWCHGSVSAPRPRLLPDVTDNVINPDISSIFFSTDGKYGVWRLFYYSASLADRSAKFR
jgi:hypothetical protein